MTGWSSVSAFETRISGPNVPLADSGAAAGASSGRSVRANVQAVPGVDDAPAELAVGEAREVDARADRVAAADPRHLPELAERLDDPVGDRLGRPEHVDPRLAVRGQRRARLGRDRVALDEQHRVARLRGPRGGGHRVPGIVGRRDDDRVALLAARGRREGVECVGERERVGAGHVGRLQAGRPGDVADADDLRVARLLRPRRRERAERVLARGGEVGAGRVQDRRADRLRRRAPTRRSRRASRASRRAPRRSGASSPTAPERRRGRRRPRWRSRPRRRRASCSSSRRPGSRGCPRRRPGCPSRRPSAASRRCAR